MAHATAHARIDPQHSKSEKGMMVVTPRTRTFPQKV
jgi:hypothetical protein